MIILDLDGVLADFTSAACAVHGKYGATKINKWNFFKDWGITEREFWAKIKAHGDDFYRESVLPFSWALDLLAAVEQTDEYVIMSTPACGSPEGYAGKKIWVDKYLQPHVLEPIELIVGGAKHLMAQPDRLLIDDYDKNVENFRKAGGHAITFPQPWNVNTCRSTRALKYTQDHLLEWTGIYQDEQRKKKRLQDCIKRFIPVGDSPGY